MINTIDLYGDVNSGEYGLYYAPGCGSVSCTGTAASSGGCEPCGGQMCGGCGGNLSGGSSK